MLSVEVVDGTPTRVRVAEQDRARVYPVAEREHGAWLDLFRRVAADFGTRAPRGGQTFAAPPADDRVEPLLTRNIDPRIRDGYGDPAVLRTEAGYYLVATSNDAPDAFPILRSRDLRDWEMAGFVFPRARAPAWTITGEGVADFWAPELHRAGDGYLLCFTARNRERELCIGLAGAGSPDGPFVADPEPLLTGGVIDANLFARRDGTLLLFWKEDSNAVWPRRLARLLRDDPALIDMLFDSAADRRTAELCVGLWGWAERATPMEQFFSLQPLIEAVVARYGQVRERLHAHSDVIAAMRTPVYAQPLSPDARALAGERRVVLVNDLAWEGHLIEGNWVTEQRGRYYLFYSGNDFSTPDYGIGVAIADDPLGPYRKMPEPLLRTTAAWWGPGHPSVAPGPDGVPRLFFHAFPPGTGGYKAFRALLSARLAFHPDRVELLPA